MCRYFNFDELFTDDTNTINLFDSLGAGEELQNNRAYEDERSTEEESFKMGVLHVHVFSVIFFFSRNKDQTICQKALFALGLLCNKIFLLNFWI